MSKRDSPPVLPGEVLVEEFLEPMGIMQYRLAKDISVPQRRTSEIVHGKRAITSPLREFVQTDGRVRRWVQVPEMDNRYLRVILLSGRETVHTSGPALPTSPTSR